MRIRSARHGRLTALPLVLIIGLFTTSCGGVGGSPGGAVSGIASTIAASSPSGFVALSPTATETLLAIGAGDLVVAADDQST